MLSNEDRQLLKEHTRQLKEFNQRAREQSKELWGNSADLKRLTGWTPDQMRQARISGKVKFKIKRERTNEKGKNEYSYNLNSIDPKYFNNPLKVAS